MGPGLCGKVTCNDWADVAELADALDSKSSVPKGRVGSTPSIGTILSSNGIGKPHKRTLNNGD